MKWLILLCPVLAFSATSEHRLHSVQRETLVRSNATAVSPVPPVVQRNAALIPPVPKRTNAYYTNGFTVAWSVPLNAGPPYVTYRISGTAALGKPWRILGTNSVPKWTVYKSNGPSQLIRCDTLDADMAYTSDGKAK